MAKVFNTIIKSFETSGMVPHKNQTENSVSSLNLQKKFDFKFENQHFSVSYFTNWNKIQQLTVSYRPLGNNRLIFFMWGFLKDDILACVETWD